MSEDTIYAICQRVDALPEPYIDGSVRTRCTDCATGVWLAPTTQQYAAQVKIVCDRCMAARIEVDGTKVALMLRREQAEEIRKNVRPFWMAPEVNHDN